MNVKLLAVLIWLPVAAVAQGFAGLGTLAGEGFAEPEPGKVFSFPDCLLYTSPSPRDA